MTLFRVWAPQAMTVEMVLSDQRRAMTPGERGWWSLESPDAGPGTDYWYAIDGGEPLPDPQSPWQPEGVSGPSRVVDHSAFQWTDAGWQAPSLASAVIYELHVGTFTPEGTFDGVISRLDYLVDLGVTHVEVMPVNEFPGNHGWGYDGVDLYAPHHAYGGPEGLKRLVDACHRCGLGVILDVVYNHLGPAGNYLDRYGPYFADWYTTPWGPAVNFDGPDSDEVRRFVCDNAIMWFRDYHTDGLRIDAVHAIFDMSAGHILEQLSEEVERLEAQLGRHLVLIAESDLNNPRVVQSREAGGYGIDAQWNDDFHHALHSMLTGERSGYYADFGSLGHIAKALTRGFVYDGTYSVFRRRSHGRPPVGLPGRRLVGFLQNHDQIGNRARGERISHLTAVERLKIGAALVLTAPFVPMVFQGEEWGASTPFLYFTDYEDSELGETVTRGRREEFAAFGWKAEEVPDPQALTSFNASKLNWGEISREPHAGLFGWYRELLRLRRSLPALRDDRLQAVRVQYDEERQWLIVERGPVMVVCNAHRRKQEIAIPAEYAELLAASQSNVRLKSRAVQMPPDSVAVFFIGSRQAVELV